MTNIRRRVEQLEQAERARSAPKLEGWNDLLFLEIPEDAERAEALIAAGEETWVLGADWLVWYEQGEEKGRTTRQSFFEVIGFKRDGGKE